MASSPERKARNSEKRRRDHKFKQKKNFYKELRKEERRYSKFSVKNNSRWKRSDDGEEYSEWLSDNF